MEDQNIIGKPEKKKKDIVFSQVYSKVIRTVLN